MNRVVAQHFSAGIDVAKDMRPVGTRDSSVPTARDRWLKR